MIYVIVENVPSYENTNCCVDDCYECLCHSLGYFTDADAVEQAVEKQNKKWRIQYVAKFNRASLTKLAENEDIYPLLDKLVQFNCIGGVDSEEYETVESALNRYGYIQLYIK